MTEEDRIQADIVDFLRTVLPVPRWVIFAVPNGGARSKVEAAIMKRTGTLAGIPDIGIVAAGGKSYWLEVKTKSGRLSDAQKLMHNLFVGMGVPVAVVRSIDDTRVALAAWGVATREAAEVQLSLLGHPVAA